VTAKAPVVASKRNGVEPLFPSQSKADSVSLMARTGDRRARGRRLRIYNAAIARLLPQGKR